jgi:hypothetical protein
VQLIGIDDSEHPSQVERELAKLQIDKDRFVLLLYHAHGTGGRSRSWGRSDDFRPYSQRADRAV